MKIDWVGARLRRSVQVGLVLGVLLLCTISTIAGAVVVASGTDCWTTSPPSTAQIGPFPASYFTAPGRTSLAMTAQTISVTGVPAPPPGTCPCADPIIHWTDQHGNPVQPGDKHGVNQTVIPSNVDTCVRRNSSANLTAVGSPVSVPTEILFLHLRGALSVPMNTGAACTYTVDIQISGSQSTGSLSFNPVAPDLRSGTVNLSSLPVGAQVTFAPTSGCDNGTPQSVSTNFVNTPGVYNLSGVFPSMNVVGIAVLVVGLLLGMAFMLWRHYRVNVEA